MSKDKARIAVAGCGVAGWMGHLPWIWAHPNAEITAVCDSDLVRARQAQERFDVGFVTTSFDEILQRDDVDGVCICTPQRFHREMTVAAVRHGKHVLLEKPMGLNVQECREMLDAADKANVFLMVGHEKRFNYACQKVKEIIDSGDLGKVFSFDVHWCATVKNDPDKLIPEGYRGNYEWRWKDTSSGGGILLDHLPHYVDLWRWWTDSEVDTVSAEVLNVTRDLLGKPEIATWEDYCRVSLRFKNGTLANFETGTVGRGLSPILHNGSNLGEWSEFGTLLGTRGQLVYDLPPWDSPEHGRLMVNSLEERKPENRGWYQVALPDARRLPGGPLTPVTNDKYKFQRQTDHFVESIRENRQPEVDGHDGLATLLVVEAAYEAARTGKKVHLAHKDG